MKLVLLTHPTSFGTNSMPRFAGMIRRGMKERGLDVQCWTSPEKMGSLSTGSAFVSKWLRYADQFLVFPKKLRKLVDQQPADTLFVITDQALGMWVPCVARRRHVIHCHDFLALKSALGEFPQNPVGWTGRQYQQLIRKGFSQGQAFISVSQKTREDLHRFLPRTPRISEMVYNGLNYAFRPMEIAERTALLAKTGLTIPREGFVLHISGYQWYKNPRGVIEIYRAYSASRPNPLPLWMVGPEPSPQLAADAASVPAPGKIQFVSGLNDEQVNAAYAHARALLFPSLEEGFGWPVVEAMASGCPVITTDVAPMTETSGNAARLIPRMPASSAEQQSWAKSAGEILAKLVEMEGAKRTVFLEEGKLQAARFDTATAIRSYEEIYRKVIAN